MKKSELKDGYLLNLAGGEQFYVCGKYGLHQRYEDPLYLEKYTEDLLHSGTTDFPGWLDVVSVSYQGEVLWTRDSWQSSQGPEVRMVDYYYAEWKHPETKAWRRVWTPIPSVSAKALQVQLAQDCGIFSPWGAEFQTLKHLKPEWNAEPTDKLPVALIAKPEGEYAFQVLSTRDEYNLTNCDELLFDWVVKGIFGREWF